MYLMRNNWVNVESEVGLSVDERKVGRQGGQMNLMKVQRLGRNLESTF